MSTRPAPATFLQTPQQLAEHLGLPVEPLSAVHAVYPLRISRYYLDLIRQVGPPLWKQAVPDLQELGKDKTSYAAQFFSNNPGKYCSDTP